MFVYWVLIALHVVVSLCLMVVVLLQSGKGGGLAGAFGGAGASQTLFGGRGAGTFLTKATQVLGAAFMLSALILVMLGGLAGRQPGISEESLRLIESFQEEQLGAPAADLPSGEIEFPSASEGFQLPGEESAPGGEGGEESSPTGIVPESRPDEP